MSNRPAPDPYLEILAAEDSAPIIGLYKRPLNFPVEIALGSP
jgi:hypothetical protein